ARSRGGGRAAARAPRARARPGSARGRPLSARRGCRRRRSRTRFAPRWASSRSRWMRRATRALDAGENPPNATLRQLAASRDGPLAGSLTAPSAAATLARVQATSVVTAERFAQGMTFDRYVVYTGTPENLAREAGWWLGTTRHDFSGLLRARYEQCRLSDAQVAAIRWLAAQPEGPARILLISEEWSSDCRRDVPMVARLAEAGGLELKIFPRDGQKLGRGPKADPVESPNADIVNAFLNVKDGQTFQTVPTVVFLTKAFEVLYTYFEFPAIYHKMQLAKGMGVPTSRENREKEWERFLRDWGALQESSFWQMWTSAAVDEMLSALHERLVVGS